MKGEFRQKQLDGYSRNAGFFPSTNFSLTFFSFDRKRYRPIKNCGWPYWWTDIYLPLSIGPQRLKVLPQNPTKKAKKGKKGKNKKSLKNQRKDDDDDDDTVKRRSCWRQLINRNGSRHHCIPKSKESNSCLFLFFFFFFFQSSKTSEMKPSRRQQSKWRDQVFRCYLSCSREKKRRKREKRIKTKRTKIPNAQHPDKGVCCKVIRLIAAFPPCQPNQPNQPTNQPTKQPTNQPPWRASSSFGQQERQTFSSPTRTHSSSAQRLTAGEAIELCVSLFFTVKMGKKMVVS